MRKGSTIGETLANIMKDSGLEVTPLSLRTGVSEQALYKWRNGAAYPSKFRLDRFLHACGVREPVDIATVYLQLLLQRRAEEQSRDTATTTVADTYEYTLYVYEKLPGVSFPVRGSAED